MSYDLHLFLLFAGETPEEALARTLTQSDEINPGLPVPEKELRKKQLAAALMRHNAALEVFAFDFADIARMLGMSEQEARLRWRHIELNGPVEGNGIQITLSDDGASISIPYWHSGEKAEDVFGEVWNCIEVLQKEGGYVAFDPQLERVVNRSSHFAEMLSTYCRVTKDLHDPGDRGAKRKEHWWKFW